VLLIFYIPVSELNYADSVVPRFTQEKASDLFVVILRWLSQCITLFQSGSVLLMIEWLSVMAAFVCYQLW